MHLWSYQVVKEDMRGLGWQISNIEQQLPQHVDQLILENQHKSSL